MLYCSKHDFFSLFSFFYRKKIWFSSGSYYISYKEHAELFFSLKMSRIFVTALPMLPGFSGPPGLGVVATAAVLSGGRQQGGGGVVWREGQSPVVLSLKELLATGILSLWFILLCMVHLQSSWMDTVISLKGLSPSRSRIDKSFWFLRHQCPPQTSGSTFHLHWTASASCVRDAIKQGSAFSLLLEKPNWQVYMVSQRSHPFARHLGPPSISTGHWTASESCLRDAVKRGGAFRFLLEKPNWQVKTVSWRSHPFARHQGLPSISTGQHPHPAWETQLKRGGAYVFLLEKPTISGRSHPFVRHLGLPSISTGQHLHPAWETQCEVALLFR